jgi:hypothetical protein
MRTIHFSSVGCFRGRLKGDSSTHREDGFPDTAGFIAFIPVFTRYNQRKQQCFSDEHKRKNERNVMATNETRLEKIIAAWPTLPAHIKMAIQDIIRANTVYQNSWTLWPGRVSRLQGDDQDRGRSQPVVNREELKCCTQCNQWKEKNQFYKNSRSKDGLKSRCKECSREAAKKYRRKKQTTKK